jgi:hypoxanthine phosphoribosyltransferase
MPHSQTDTEERSSAPSDRRGGSSPAPVGRSCDRYNGPMDDDIERILITREQIQARVRELAGEIVGIYGHTGLTIVAILHGALIFLSDLMREIPFKMQIALMTVSSYRGATTQSGEPVLTGELSGGIEGQHVLLVDDILDTGNTLRFVQQEIEGCNPASMRTCVLLRKTGKAPPEIKVDLVGFDIEDRFVVGYGLDYNNLYRNYPHIGVLRAELY